jgi:hypothetical protein
VAGVLWALPTLAFADGDDYGHKNVGHECSYGSHKGNPHCQVPEVPFTVVYPALGIVTLGVWEVLRRRRNALGEQ